VPTPIIKIEGISKKYIIGHQQAERYTALRDVIANNVKQAVKKAKKLVSRASEMNGVSREDFWALKDVSFEINEGDRLGIIGRNGAGKSTLLKILSRITEPTTGRITMRGRVASLLEVGTGFHPELTGRENVFLNGAILGMSRAEIRRKFDEIVAFAEVEKFLDTPVKRYSSGMYVRLAFAVAAHLEPEILIVDEVLAVGDAQFQKKCLGKMEDVSKNEGRTILFVSHNMGVLAQFCNKGVMLVQGKLASQGSIDETIGAYISSANNAQDGVYIGTGTANAKNYFKHISTVNGAGEVTTDFSFDDSINLKFDFQINDLVPNILIGIGIQDKLQNRVTTIVKPISFFNKNGNDYSGRVKIPGSILAPNSYSFVFAIWVKDLAVYDSVENVCPIAIHDNGTELANFEGFDYGSVIIKPTWLRD
jgi:lipopolysaccharide transport system ATP-binding protein